METVVNLDANDIRKIIAEHYRVDLDSVTVATRQETRGYGLSERQVYVPVCTVRRNGGLI